VLYDAANATIFINADDALGTAEMVIVLQNPIGTLSSGDFLFV
jgi:hypothetical protein